MVTLQQVIFKLSEFWASRGCLLQTPRHEMGAGTMHPETFLRVLGPSHWSVAYVQPSRRRRTAALARTPTVCSSTSNFRSSSSGPDEVQQLYLQSLEACGIDLRAHDSGSRRTTGSLRRSAPGVSDGRCSSTARISPSYLLPAGRWHRPSPISVELTYGNERLAMTLQDVDNVFEVEWAPGVKYRDVRHRDEVEQSKYPFGQVDMPKAELHAFHRTLDEDYLLSETLLRSKPRAASARLLPEVLAHVQPARCERGDWGHRTDGVHPRVRQLAVAIAKAWVGEGRTSTSETTSPAAYHDGTMARGTRWFLVVAMFSS